MVIDAGGLASLPVIAKVHSNPDSDKLEVSVHEKSEKNKEKEPSIDDSSEEGKKVPAEKLSNKEAIEKVADLKESSSDKADFVAEKTKNEDAFCRFDESNNDQESDEAEKEDPRTRDHFTILSADETELSSDMQFQIAKEFLKPTMSGMYGVVEMLTQEKEAAIRIKKGTKPVIHLCHPEPVPDPIPSLKPAMNLQEQLRQRAISSRREERKLRKMASLPTPNELNATGRDSILSGFDSGGRSLTESEEEEDESRRRDDYEWNSENKKREHKKSCKKHSQCHCFLFSLDSIGFYALTS